MRIASEQRRIAPVVHRAIAIARGLAQRYPRLAARVAQQATFERARQMTWRHVRSLDYTAMVRRNAQFSIDPETGRTILRVRRASRYMRDFTPEVMNEWGELLLAECRQNSGTQYYSLDELRMLGHPYGLPTAAAPWRSVDCLGFPDAIINWQTGDFHSQWGLQVTTEGSEATAEVVNTSEHARYLTRFGTRFMRPRRIMEFSYERARPAMNNAVRRGIYRVKRRALAA